MTIDITGFVLAGVISAVFSAVAGGFLTTPVDERLRKAKIITGYLLFFIGLTLNFLIIIGGIEAGIDWEKARTRAETNNFEISNRAEDDFKYLPK